MNNRPLWDKNSEIEVKHLRQPKCLAQNSAVEAPKLPTEQPSRLKELEDILAKSELKADAPEWFPKAAVNKDIQMPTVYNQVENLTHSVQNRLKIHKKNTNSPAQAFPAPRVSMDMPRQNGGDYNSLAVGSNGENQDIKRLKQIVTTLTKDPGQFDNLLELFMETIFPHLNDIMFLSHFTKLLVEQAVSNPNFRYTAARLCWFIEQNSAEFRAELHLLCKKILDLNNITQNFLLLIGELYIQLPHLEIYGTLLIQCMKNLLRVGGDSNIKCICQALKLTGYNLDKTNPNDLNEVLEQLNQLKPVLNGSLLMLLTSVLNLRTVNWGHSDENTDSEHESDEFAYEGQERTIYYQQDGSVLTNEESTFIAAHDEYLSDDSNPDDLCDPEPEMDEEIQAAFREFVKYGQKP